MREPYRTAPCHDPGVAEGGLLARRHGVVIDREGLVEFARQLVREASVNDPEGGRSERGAALLVAERMRSFGWEPRIDEVAPGRPNVVAVVEGGLPGGTLLFEGHTDVVTEGPREAWSVDPFGGE